MYKTRLLTLLFLSIQIVAAQGNADAETELLDKILNRLESLEKQNRELTDEVRLLRQKLTPAAQGEQAGTASAAQTMEERVAVNERRVEEQAQTKVESAQRLPVTLNGMVLFNAFLNSGGVSSAWTQQAYPDFLTGPNSSGATLRQTLLGLEFDGPQVLHGGKTSGFLSLDLAGGAGAYSWIRLRRAGVAIDWEHRSLSVGQDKPLVSVRQPNSLAEVAIPPLSDSGNLWLWLPQLRYEERHRFTSRTGFKLQGAVLQTSEAYAYVPNYFTTTLEASRPALEGRAVVTHMLSETARVEVGAGFHISTSHVAGTSVASSLGSVDWLFQPAPWIQLTGTYFQGQNLGNIGGPAQSFTVVRAGEVKPVHADGGWLQLSFPVTSRLTLNTYGGWQSARDRDLAAGLLDNSDTFAANAVYRIGPNVFVSLEAAQQRFHLFTYDHEAHHQNHYDLALGYAF